MKVPPQAWPACKALVADMRDAPTLEEGQRRLQHRLARDQATVPAACRCLEAAAEARLHPLKVPGRHRPYGRTSHLAERAFEEKRRRTQVIPHLWDETSCLQWVCAVRMGVRERWGKKPLSEFAQHQRRAFRQT